ncbi:MAG: hypothetical protein Q7R60_02800 [bacterium]|nr:hypothetical protein [bacterium]
MPKSPEFDYRTFPDDSLFGSGLGEKPVVYPQPHERVHPVPDPQEADRLDDQAQFTDLQIRERAGMLTPDDEQRQEVAEVRRRVAKNARTVHVHKPVRGRMAEAGDQNAARRKTQTEQDELDKEARAATTEAEDVFGVVQARRLAQRYGGKDQGPEAA